MKRDTPYSDKLCPTGGKGFVVDLVSMMILT